MDDERLLIQLRDCFTGGYTLPQFCIDNGIKRPLFVAEGKFWQFVWEIYVQFRYDKRMTAQFSFLDVATGNMDFSLHGIIGGLQIKHISQVNPTEIDAVICLTTKKIFSDGRVIYLDILAEYFFRKTYIEIPLLNFLKRYPKVKLFLTNFPSSNKYKFDSDIFKDIFDMEVLKKLLLENETGTIRTPLSKFNFNYTNQEIYDMIAVPDVITNLNGTTQMKDTDEFSLQRIKNGKRVTAYQPEHFRNKIYFFGSCHQYGKYAPFDKTIASYLQKMLNENNLPYRVENESQRYAGRFVDIFYNLNNMTPAPGDIIFVWIDNLQASGIPFFDVSTAFDPPNDFRKIFVEPWHVNELGYKIIAEKYFDFLTANNFFRDVEFKYPPPVNLFIATVYRHNAKREVQKFSSTRNWRLTKKIFGRKNFQSVRSS